MSVDDILGSNRTTEITVPRVPASSGGKRRPRVSVVVPAMNEARNLPHVLGHMPKDIDEVILVDGNSVDDTVEVARKCWPGIIVVNQARKGKGNALAAGFAACTGDYIVMIDADGSMDPREISRFTAALDAGADYAKGSRFAKGGGSDDITRLRKVGNWGLNFMTNVLFRTHFSDLCYGYNAFRKDCVPIFGLPDHTDATAPRWGDGFEIETLINTRVAKSGVRIDEVASFEFRRMYGESNLQTFRDGFRVVRTIMRERFGFGAPAEAPAGQTTTAA
ncbi:glycosyltransferase family 2 protein [Paractinoplanes toevensis]|uniref:Glycosyltransferase 2-like domain-containing protein n=1 Tax=Paractinoplanes toevensis TaxID=571911 RepID=A0A919TFM1_9ACTN|nr:glycosyltransferase family 2 protein [Actinoplanes toevensis]GIM93131.1 hypothetical protein Ato02nite_049240 [Actinoplanes toevensis]